MKFNKSTIIAAILATFVAVFCLGLWIRGRD